MNRGHTLCLLTLAVVPRAALAVGPPPPPARTPLFDLPPAAEAATLVDEDALPQAVSELHPVRDPFLAQWQRHTARSMSGPGASIWYRDLSTRLDVTWRLAELSANPVQLDTAVRDQALDQAIAGATQGWDDAVRRAIRRTPELAPLHTIGRSLFTPTLQVRRGRHGQAQVTTDDRSARTAQAALAEIDQATPVAGGTARSPALRTGSAITLVRIPSSADVRSGADRESPLAPGMLSWVEVRDLPGIDAARVQARVSADPERPRFRPQARWVGVLRKSIHPEVALVADVRGRPDMVTPERQMAAVDVSLSRVGLPAWALRASASRELREDLEPGLIEDRLMVSVRANLGWYLPQDVERWPLGQRPLAPGPVFPELPAAGPTAPMPLVSTPAQRTGGPAEPPPTQALAAAPPPE